MARCVECIHFGICNCDCHFCRDNGGDVIQMQESKYVESNCEHFTSKTETAREIFAEITNLLLSLVYLGADCKWHTAKKYANKLHSFMEGYLGLQEKYCGKDTNVPTESEVET